MIEVRFCLKLGELVVQDDAHKELETYLSLSLGLSQWTLPMVATAFSQ
jgi:hypothetical protein